MKDKPIKIIQKNSLFELCTLGQIIEEMGYPVKLNTSSNQIEIYSKEVLCSETFLQS